jgi:ketosteroid isomerase-like protein
MKKQHLALTLALTTALLLTAGCATLGGSSDQDQITELIATWQHAFENADVEAAMRVFSEDFKSEAMLSKDIVRQYLEDDQRETFLETADIDTTDLVITINDDTAVAEPIYVINDADEALIWHDLKKEADGWKIVHTRRGAL